MNQEEKEKHIDNRIIKDTEESAYKKKIDSLNDKIDIEKNKINDINDMEDIIRSLNKSIDECVEILRESMSGNNVNRKLNNIEENNTINLNNAISDFDIKRDEIKKEISKLYSEKNSIEEDYRRKFEIKKEGE